MPAGDFRQFGLYRCRSLADRAVRRSLRYGQRTRSIHLLIPVLQPELWRHAAPLLESLARFASADLWTIEFVSSSQRLSGPPEIEPQPQHVVALFSGGLDSLCGAAWLARQPGSPVFVSHSPPGRETCLSLIQDTWQAFGLDPLPAKAYISFRLEVRERTRHGTRSMFQEPTRRTRPFFFLSLACAVAVELGIPNIQMSENGAYALSLPFRADAHGALCSRQAHAYLLDGFRELLSKVAPALGMVTMEEAAQRLGVSSTSIRRMIKPKKMPATQVVACAPWQIAIEALESEEVRKAVRNIKARARAPRTQGSDQQQAMFSMVWRDNS